MSVQAKYWYFLANSKRLIAFAFYQGNRGHGQNTFTKHFPFVGALFALDFICFESRKCRGGRQLALPLYDVRPKDVLMWAGSNIALSSDANSFRWCLSPLISCEEEARMRNLAGRTEQLGSEPLLHTGGVSVFICPVTRVVKFILSEEPA